MTELAQIREEIAPPETALIYSEIKAVSGLPMVNLIWRHLATVPDVLPWAWKTVAPLVSSQEMAIIKQEVADSIQLPEISKEGRRNFQATRFDERDRREVCDVVDAYIDGNLTNVIALTTLRLRLKNPNRPAAKLTPTRKASNKPSDLRRLPRTADLDTAIVARLRELARYHEGAGSDVIPSFYLALSYWPEVIEGIDLWLSTLYEKKALSSASLGISDLVEMKSESLFPPLISPPASARSIEPVLERFTRLLIPDLISVCVALKRLMNC